MYKYQDLHVKAHKLYLDILNIDQVNLLLFEKMRLNKIIVRIKSPKTSCRSIYLFMEGDFSMCFSYNS